ncbi:hypothetical protein BO71DRAFT_476744 [Aspergillus ellipticus CBS 707.79]|uniref:Uncharacterized protein n=1 Tax=Aspergillus ellipticus CBS 707.79 TaxID=1448320 RepID=A0A319EEK1_9EURO|nr:hypothetical protein BO71DRAFT_476744 [Aspergillus ellipticus CBS 707.79]
MTQGLLDFEYFKCEILTPEAYSTATRQFYGENPTASLELLPRISELSIQFCEPIDTGVWDNSCLDLNICDFEQSFNHHAQTVTEALRASKNGDCFRDYFIGFLGVDTGLTLKCLELRHLMIRDSLYRIALYDTEIFGVSEAGSFSYEVSRQIRSIMFSEFQSTVKNEPGQDPMITTPGTNHVSLVWRKTLQPIESREDEHSLVFDTDGAISLTLFSSLNGSEAGPRSSSGDTDKTVTITFRAYERGRWKKMCSLPVTKSDIREAQRVADQYAQAEHQNARFYDRSLRKVSVNWCVHAVIHDGTFTILMSLGRSLHITR